MARKRRSWHEWQHPRDERGRFSHKGTGSTRWAQRALTQLGQQRPELMNMSAGPVSSRGTKLPADLSVGDVIEIPSARVGIAPVRGRVKQPPLIRKGVDAVVRLEPLSDGRSNFQPQVYLRPDVPVDVTTVARGEIRGGAPSGRIDLGALVRENAAFHGPKEETTSVLPDRDFGGSMDRAVHYVRQLRTTGVPDEGALRMSYRNALQQIELEFRYGNYQRAANRVQVAASLNRALDMLQRNSGKPEDIATLRGAVKTFGGKPFDPPDPPRQLTQNVSAGKMDAGL